MPYPSNWVGLFYCLRVRGAQAINQTSHLEFTVMRSFEIIVSKRIGAEEVLLHKIVVENVRSKAAAVRQLPMLREECAIERIREIYR
jgi:hypothetical protein